MTQEYLYQDYVKTLSNRFLANLDSIKTGHNFDYGIEFEIVLCQTLRHMLPDKYGVVRGYVVDKNGNSAGDDIIIFEQTRFPTLALRDKNDFSRKEFVPIEAVYAYIEAKHTTHIQGNSNQGLVKAFKQVNDVKKLCASRTPVLPTTISPYVELQGKVEITVAEGYHPIVNPVFGVILARQVSRGKGKESMPAQEIIDGVDYSSIEVPYKPDLVILGKDILMIPSKLSEDKKSAGYSSPFMTEGKQLGLVQVEGISFGVGLISLMSALDSIQLGNMLWHQIIIDSLKISK